MRALFICILILFSGDLFYAQSTVIFSGKEQKIGKNIGILEDKTNTLTIKDVVSSGEFKAGTEENPNLGVSSSSFWLKFQVKNETEIKPLLELGSPLIDNVELYAFLPGKILEVQKAGESFTFFSRKYKSQNYIFDIDVPRDSTYTYFMKIKSSEQIQLPLTLASPQSVFESDSKGDLFSGIYFGIIIIMLFYNLFIYFTIKDKGYLYYVVYIIFIGLTQACLHGYTFRYLWPGSSWMAIHSVFLIPSLTGITAIAFVNNFLQIKKYLPFIYKFSFLIGTVYFVAIIFGISGVYVVSYNIIDFNALLLSAYMLYVAIRITKKGYRPARFFLIAWSFFLLCVVIFVMKSKNVLPYNNFTNYILEIGSAVEVLLLSFALADRINILRKEKEESQSKAVEALKENERITSQQNIILDRKVKERTAELETSNQHLKDTQVQLVNAEKMASLGQLTAGIAHEINNPINFVISNVYPLKRDIDDILLLLASYSEIKEETNISEKLKEINNLKKKLDSDYLVHEIGLLLKGIDEGASRTSEIVKSLQNFSRLDEDALKIANIHSGIDATLLLLNSTINNSKINIIKEYGSFPDIECYPGKLNQVFMNILNNAIQALQSDNKEYREIKITTELKNNWINIHIKDNGPGMSEEVKNRIFEPFFTTKNVGEGSGLGLSIVYGIIEKHKGKITVESAPGLGTEFIISLPVHIDM